MSDNEHAAAALWNSKELSVKHSVGEPIPEFCQPSENGTKVPSSVRRQDAGDVLPHQPSGARAVSKLKKLECQVATVVGQPASKSSDRERLAGGSSDKKVNWAILIGSDGREVAMKGNIRIVMGQDGSRECLDFAKRCRPPSERMPRDSRRFDA
jgi:hypothetical protein